MIIKESEIGRRKFFFEHCSIQEQSDRGTFAQVGWNDQDLTVSDEEDRRHMPGHLLTHDDPAIIEREMKIFAIKGRVSHPIHLSQVKAGIAQATIQSGA